jgi:hypothetical protein
MRRGILDHLLDGRLTAVECFALEHLILLADGGTGGDIINAPLLCHWTGHLFNQDTAARILSELHRKRYIWYRASRSKRAQPYFVNRYLLTKGRMMTRMTNLAELFEREAICVDDVLRLADDGADHDKDDDKDHDADDHADHDKDDGADHDADNYNNENETEKESEKEKETLRFAQGGAGGGAPASDELSRDGVASGSSSSGQGRIANPRSVSPRRQSSPVQQQKTNNTPTTSGPAAPATPPQASAAARGLALGYLARMAAPKRHQSAAETSWPVVFDRLLQDRSEADLASIITYAWETSDFWASRMDRSDQDPAMYLAEKIETIAESWIKWQRGRERYERETAAAQPPHPEDEPLWLRQMSESDPTRPVK